jgi:hypothetical protein
MKTDFKYHPYNIDTSDIWEYERNAYIRSSNKENWQEFEELYDLLQGYILETGVNPFLRKEELTSDNHYLKDFKNHYAEKNLLDFFVCKGDFYDMQEHCLIKYKETSPSDFEKLFMLKLRQFRDKLREVKGFLQYQLKQNFKNKLDEFTDFLRMSFLQHPGLVDKIIVGLIGEWINEQKEEITKSQRRRSKNPRKKYQYEEVINIEALPVHEENESCEKNDGQTGTKFSVDNEDSGQSMTKIENSELSEDYELAATNVQKNNEGGIPKGYILVEGKFSMEETRAYFSFLYKEKDESGKPFLPEADVKDLFKYGLAIPPKPPKKRYRLHSSLKFPKGIVEFCIYKFYTNHTNSHLKKDVLKFFASYIKDFEKALQSDDDMQTWSDNVTGKRPARIKFDFNNYLPERMR